METKLARISQLSSENPGMVFTSVGHLINKELLKECPLYYEIAASQLSEEELQNVR